MNQDPRTYYKLAKLTGLHLSTVTKFADGGTPSSAVLDKLAAVLGLRVVRR